MAVAVGWGVGGGIFNVSPTTITSSSALPLYAINSGTDRSYSSAIRPGVSPFLTMYSRGGTGVGVPVGVAVARGVAVGSTIERVGVRVTVGVSAAIADWRVLCTMMATNNTMTMAVKMMHDDARGALRGFDALLARDRFGLRLFGFGDGHQVRAAIHARLGARRDDGAALRAHDR